MIREISILAKNLQISRISILSNKIESYVYSEGKKYISIYRPLIWIFVYLLAAVYSWIILKQTYRWILPHVSSPSGTSYYWILKINNINSNYQKVLVLFTNSLGNFWANFALSLNWDLHHPLWANAGGM